MRTVSKALRLAVRAGRTIAITLARVGAEVLLLLVFVAVFAVVGAFRRVRRRDHMYRHSNPMATSYWTTGAARDAVQEAERSGRLRHLARVLRGGSKSLLLPFLSAFPFLLAQEEPSEAQPPLRVYTMF